MLLTFQRKESNFVWKIYEPWYLLVWMCWNSLKILVWQGISMMYGTHFSILNTYWKPLWPECAILYIIQEFSKLFFLYWQKCCVCLLLGVCYATALLKPLILTQKISILSLFNVRVYMRTGRLASIVWTVGVLQPWKILSVVIATTNVLPEVY